MILTTLALWLDVLLDVGVTYLLLVEHQQQRFLAAYRISTLEASEQERNIEDSLDKRHLETMLHFYAGLS